MKRNKFLRNLSLGLIAGTGLVSCKTDPEKIEKKNTTRDRYRWKMVTTWAPNFPILGEGCQMLAQWVEEMSDGEMTIHVYGGNELVPALETFEAVSIGGIEMGNAASYYWAGKIPAAQYFASVPFGLNAQQMNTWLEAAGGMELWEEIYEPFNLIPFNSGNTGAQMGGWYNKKVEKIEDLKGLKMRIPGLGGKVLKKAGGTPVLSAGSEIYTNLERGVIDATEWLGPFHDYKMGFHQIARYYYTPGWHETGTCLETIINKSKFDKLPDHLKAILEAGIARLRNWILDQFEYRNAEYLQIIRDETDVEIRHFPEEVLNRLKSLTIQTLKELADSDEQAAKINASFNDFRKKIGGWSKLSEMAFYDRLM
jgi:TRAP-type mannitol/chloroaromatic compound transport system substrate-binding protein